MMLVFKEPTDEITAERIADAYQMGKNEGKFINADELIDHLKYLAEGERKKAQKCTNEIKRDGHKRTADAYYYVVKHIQGMVSRK